MTLREFILQEFMGELKAAEAFDYDVDLDNTENVVALTEACNEAAWSVLEAIQTVSKEFEV